MTALARRLDEIAEKTGMREAEIAQLLKTTPQNVNRWRRAQVEPKPSHLRRILELTYAIEELGELYAPDEARLWLYSRHKLLAGRSPAELIVEGEFDTVLRLISQLKDGAYV
jgi:transcriptional regulator with XRE-family HTH domain